MFSLLDTCMYMYRYNIFVGSVVYAVLMAFAASLSFSSHLYSYQGSRHAHSTYVCIMIIIVLTTQFRICTQQLRKQTWVNWRGWALPITTTTHALMTRTTSRCVWCGVGVNDSDYYCMTRAVCIV